MISLLSDLSDLLRSPLSFARVSAGGFSRRSAALARRLAAAGFLAGASTGTAQDAGVRTTIHEFQFTDSEVVPSGGLILGSDGNFYGATIFGGSNQTGAVYRVTPAGTLTFLQGFEPTRNPAPSVVPSTLTQGRDGSFYGTTEYGGANHSGSVFKLTAAGTLTALYSFENRAYRDVPHLPSALVQGGDGNFYGTTFSDGTHSGGSVFKVTPAGKLTTLHSFALADDGYARPSALVRGADGNFYGTTEYGGSQDLGTVYRITPAGVFTTLHHFKGADGSRPTPSLVQARDGNFYGLTGSGGTHDEGTFYQLTPAGTLTILHHYDSADDGGELGFSTALIQGRDGNFYGTTVAGGPFGSGSIFRFTSAGELATLFNFDQRAPGESDEEPSGLVQGRDGSFYGTTHYGGDSNIGGTIFRFTLTPPVINSPTQAAAQVGEAFSYQITATNSPASYRASGLPAGLSADTATGKITGAPTAAGTFNVALAATNGAGTDTAALVLTVKPAPLVITSSRNPPSRAGVPFAYQITATKNPTSFHTHGLPEGLGLSTTTGKISGTPTMAGTYAVTMSATNSAGTATAPLNLVVKDPALVITSSLEPPSRQGVPFSYQITASQTPTSFHTRGLPAGLGLSTTTGRISGTPRKAGTYKVALSVANSSGSGAATLTLVVKPPAP